uniref:SAP domain-containing protein n=1 Tax=Moniliophthora roreri TaxID=221103 RepID=A0A0W0GBW7_MONRR
METGDVSGEQESETPKGKERISEAEMQRVFDFPGATGDEIEQLKIYTFKNQLKELCSKYGLRKFGNVDMLCTRLVEFSENWDQRSKKPGACRTHKGPQKSKTVADPLAILQCINNKLDVVVRQQQHLNPTLSTIIPLATPRLSTNPMTPPVNLTQPISMSSVSPPQLTTVPDPCPHLQSLLTHTTTVTQPTASQATVQQTPSASSSSAFGFMQPDLGLTHPDAKWKCIVLYGEEDLDKLGRMWDDKNPDFNEKECLLRIGNPERGVPMKYWGDVLKLESPDPQDNCWEVWKCKLYPWSLIREYYNKVRKSAFWEEFTVDGCKLCQTAIYQDLLKRQPRYRGSR